MFSYVWIVYFLVGFFALVLIAAFITVIFTIVILLKEFFKK